MAIYELIQGARLGAERIHYYGDDPTVRVLAKVNTRRALSNNAAERECRGIALGRTLPVPVAGAQPSC